MVSKMPFRCSLGAAIAPITPYRTPAIPGRGLPGSANRRKGLHLPLAGPAFHGKLAVRPTKLLIRRPLAKRRSSAGSRRIWFLTTFWCTEAVRILDTRTSSNNAPSSWRTKSRALLHHDASRDRLRCVSSKSLPEIGPSDTVDEFTWEYLAIQYGLPRARPTPVT